jgi:alkylation response protein AidB-like acyl-CoA dehydrogenase
MSDLLYSEVEEDLRASIRALLADRAAPAAVLARTESGDPVDAKLWRALAELGVTGLPVPERLGGAGASWRETAVVLEELGRAVAPVPFFGSAVLATAALLAAGDETLLPDLAAGAKTAALAVPFTASPGTVSPGTTSPGTASPGTASPGTAPGLSRSGVTVAGDHLSGSVTTVADALIADVFLVPAGDELYAVDASDVTRTPLTSLDQTRPVADLAFDSAPARALGPAAPALDRALTVGAAMLAAEQLGVAQWCLDTTVEYAKTRRQFARPIGSYQAIKHRLADLWVAITEARAVSRYAADCLATDDPDTPVAAALAQAFCGPVAVKAAEECVQLHGGIGFTWEHPAHLYLKRAKSSAIALGSADRHRMALAKLVDLE